jgi:hypothetical protein
MSKCPKSRVQPFKFEKNATREDSQTMQLTVHVTQAILDEARQRGLTGEEMLELAIQRALRIKQMHCVAGSVADHPPEGSGGLLLCALYHRPSLAPSGRDARDASGRQPCWRRRGIGHASPEATCNPKSRSRRWWPGRTHNQRTDEHGETG